MSYLMAGVLRRLAITLGAGALSVLIVLGVGAGLIRFRFGATDEAARRAIQADVQRRFDEGADALGEMSARVAEARELVAAAPRDPAKAQALFAELARAVPSSVAGSAGVTVYDAALTPLAWAGRVFDLPRARADEAGSVFVEFRPVGPRLVRVDGLVERAGAAPVRTGLIVAERWLADDLSSLSLQGAFVLHTAIAPVTLAAGASPAATATDHAFAIRGENGEALAYATVTAADLRTQREIWEGRVRTAGALVVALTLLLCAVVVCDMRPAVRSWRGYVAKTLTATALLVIARLVLPWASSSAGWHPFGTPFDIALTAMLLLALTNLAIETLATWRLTRRPLRPVSASRLVLRAGAYALAGVVAGGLVLAYGEFLQDLAANRAVRLLPFSLHPVDRDRLTLACGLVMLHAAIIWAGAAAARLVAVRLRGARAHTHSLLAVVAWSAGALGVILLGAGERSSLPLLPLLSAVACAGLAAVALSRPQGPLRRTSQAARLGRLYLALLLPSVALYPLLLEFADRAKARLVAGTFAPAALSHRDDLKVRLARTLEQIDARPPLGRIVEPSEGNPPEAEPAFQIWRATDLSTFRLTSAVEVYGPNGRLASRFALRLPQTAPATLALGSCLDWDVLDEVTALGSSERHVLRASRGICENGRRTGGLVLRAMLDYRTLPFTWSELPYVASLGPNREPIEDAHGSDVEFVAYGWSRAPLFSSGTAVWRIPDDVFERLVQSRTPFWATLERDDGRFRVYFGSDRGSIYALGYPLLSSFGHLVNLAELLVLVGVLYAVGLVGATLVSGLVPSRLSGRALLREVRSSFYRKLVVAYVAGAVAPVLVLAFATRAYYSAQAQAGVAAEAIKTVTVAQRLVEDYATLQQRGAGALDYIDDQTMVIVGRAIDQPVHLFDRTRLLATSERDLFASGLLTTRASADLYRAIVLDRLPTFAGVDDVGGSEYLVAAAPVRTGERDGIVTIPATLRQREIEAQIDELDRRVLSAAVLFVLLGTAIGYWMAERVADPVNRLTRATRRIARGDLDARIAATSSDELRRLVEDFNHMAADLQRQRLELERTQRLEAWADMARQVAHDIKNPLTPIQLSAEHARRVNLDRGRPLSPVLDECVQSILSQVRLLRQIAAEFSSFASSPVATLEPTDVTALVDEVVEPYRAGLDGRIALTTIAAEAVPSLMIDRTLFARALTNVIENALHAMPGEGQLTVRTTTAERDGRPVVRVQVRDTGVGMDAESMHRLFEPYFSTKATGTGLGLTIAKRNVELNGGRIEVESERAVGTVVTIEIPAPR